LTSYAKRKEASDQAKAVKELEREMKEEKEAERKVGTWIAITAITSFFFFFFYP
jgi:hypothetical protein